MHIGGWFEVDVVVETWAPPATALAFPAAFLDELEVRVFSTRAGPTLVAAIELVSPGNKDRPETCRAFAAKCVDYLSNGVGLIIADIVTGRKANMHNELITLIGQGEPFWLREDVSIYAVAYRPTRPSDGDRVEMWPVELAVGKPLSVLPLSLRGAGCFPVDLEATYTDVRRRSRLE